MKSGLEDRNNGTRRLGPNGPNDVSMKSGLEDRNNRDGVDPMDVWGECLNEVRPGRPEQSPRPLSQPAPSTKKSQ